MRLFVSLVAICLVFAGCTVPRPQAVACMAPPAGALGFMPLAVAQATSEQAAAQMITTAMEEAVRTDRTGPVTVHVLSLSSGGQYGAFGAGFLRGWSENNATPRPDFDLVTGVSAGGLIAPAIFAGPEFDPLLDTYRGISQAQVYRQYPAITIPNRASVASTAPLNRLLRGQLSDDLINRIRKRQQHEGAQLLISAANLDTTENRVFNVGEIAASTLPIAAKRDCIVEVMMASGAIPGLFPPRNIDGELYADGGLRDHVFFRAVESARVQVARETGRDLRIEATIIINGALSRPDTPTEDSITGYFSRSAEILADEVLRDSIAETVAFVENRPHWRIKGMFAEVDLAVTGCDVSQASGTIDPCVTTALFDAGRALAKAIPIDWKTADELRAKANAL